MGVWIKTILAGVMIMAASTMSEQQAAPVRVTNSFQFVVKAPMERAAPLFGPEGERCWAGKHWDPKFIYPQPAHDEQGAVFTVQHGPHTSVWVNTIFDLKGGRMQYVALISDALVSVIDVRLTPVDKTTHVEVTYSRTALTPDANEDVKAMGAQDSNSGPEWEASIAACLHGSVH